VKLKEVEEENLKLLKDKEREKSRSKYFQEPSQNLLKYINYITKLVSSMPHSNSIRNYFEERFPRNVDICEQLISGQFQPVLLSAFKYITDLLVNLSPGSQGRESLQSPKQNANNYGHFGHQNDSRKASAPFQREFSDESFSHRQPSQEDRDYSPDNRYENSPIATSSLRIHKVPNDQNSPHRKKGSQGFEQFKSAFQKIAHEESFSCHQSPQSQKQITKQYSSLAEANNSSHDSHGVYIEKERRRITKDNTPTNEAYQFPTSIDDMNTHSSYYKQRGNENRIKRGGEESPERHMSIQGRHRDEEDDYEEEEEPRDLRVKKVTKSSKVTDDRRGSRRDVNDRSNRQITGESPSRKGKIVNQYGKIFSVTR